MQNLRGLPIGIQDFPKLRRGGYAYVDKTHHLYELAHRGGYYFLSRPRRFGKSLMVSTLDTLFRGQRDLFSDLWIAQSDWNWQENPVIRLDMSTLANFSIERLEATLLTQLGHIARHYHVELPATTEPGTMLQTLIQQLAINGPVSVLIDEYDKPILDQIDHPETMRANRDLLRHFYGILKAEDKNLHFVFLTGVTKFSKVSVFSGLNNITDISMQPDASDLLGYTREDLETVFAEHVKALAKLEDLSIEALQRKITHWYNGYHFSASGPSVYNPFSLLKLFDQKKFSAYWFESATPTFLIALLTEKKYNLLSLENLEVSPSIFNQFDIDNLSIHALLYQSGYLTIQGYDKQFDVYKLGYPNYEVNYSFANSLIHYFGENVQAETESLLMQLSRNLLVSKAWDSEHFFRLLNQVLALLPCRLHINKEQYYHGILYLILKLAGLKVCAEVYTRLGRADAVMELPDKILIFELTFNKSAQAALEQIKQKKYYDQFQDQNLPIYLVGLNFDSDTHNLNDWRIEPLSLQD